MCKAEDKLGLLWFFCSFIATIGQRHHSYSARMKWDLKPTFFKEEDVFHNSCFMKTDICEACVVLWNMVLDEDIQWNRKWLKPLTAKEVKCTTENQTQERTLGPRNLPMCCFFFPFPGRCIISSCACDTIPTAGDWAERRGQIATVGGLPNTEDEDSGNIISEKPSDSGCLWTRAGVPHKCYDRMWKYTRSQQWL